MEVPVVVLVVDGARAHGSDEVAREEHRHDVLRRQLHVALAHHEPVEHADEEVARLRREGVGLHDRPDAAHGSRGQRRRGARLGPAEEDEGEQDGEHHDEKDPAERGVDEDLSVSVQREAYVVGEELVVDRPLVGEDASLAVTARRFGYEFVGATEVTGGVRGDEGHAEKELDHHDDEEEDDGANDSDGLTVRRRGESDLEEKEEQSGEEEKDVHFD